MLKALFCSTCICLSALISTNRVYASDYFSRALSIYSEGKFFEASIEFERAIYYENDSNLIARYKYYKSLCYKGLAKYDKALEELNSINLMSLSDSLFLVLRYEQVLCSYLNNDLNQALRNIGEINKRYKDTLKILDFVPLEIICFNAGRQWGNALILWDYYIENSILQDSVREGFRQEINRLYNKNNIPRFYSPDKASKMSVFLPGSGQIYCGAVLEGAFSSLINMTFLFFTIREFYYKYYFTGYLFSQGLFGRFYKGGINRAHRLAHSKTDEGMRKFNAGNTSLLMKISEAKLPEKPGTDLKINIP